MLLPALDAFAARRRLLFVCVWGQGAADGPPRLHGFFPLERRGRWRRLPISVVRLWRHEHCYLCSPLIRRDRAAECLDAVLRWLRVDAQGAALLEADLLPADGPSATQLDEALARRGRPVFTAESSTRASARPTATRHGRPRCRRRGAARWNASNAGWRR